MEKDGSDQMITTVNSGNEIYKIENRETEASSQKSYFQLKGKGNNIYNGGRRFRPFNAGDFRAGHFFLGLTWMKSNKVDGVRMGWADLSH